MLHPADYCHCYLLWDRWTGGDALVGSKFVASTSDDLLNYNPWIIWNALWISFIPWVWASLVEMIQRLWSIAKCGGLLTKHVTCVKSERWHSLRNLNRWYSVYPSIIIHYLQIVCLSKRQCWNGHLDFLWHDMMLQWSEVELMVLVYLFPWAACLESLTTL